MRHFSWERLGHLLELTDHVLEDFIECDDPLEATGDVDDGYATDAVRTHPTDDGSDIFAFGRRDRIAAHRVS